ncbi:MAG: alpha/beta hydrolase [Nocardioides sp.]
MSETTFTSHGSRCGATLVLAALVSPTSTDLDGPAGRPCVVMAHGFGCTRDGGLMPFAERFAAAGAEVLLFDYRGFGTSEGEPRQAVSHRRQRQDYHAAVAHARTLPGVDPDRIVLWGTSYSGGHVVAVAAKDHRVAALIAQGAAVDGLAILRKDEKSDPAAPPDKGRRMVAAALRDAVGALVRRPPVLVASVGAPGDFAMLTDPHSYADYLALMGPTWDPKVCARSLLGVPFNRPVRSADQITCPALLVLAERDTIAPPEAVRETARRIGPQAEVVAFDCPHFDIYRGEVFERSVSAQVAFLQRTVGTLPPGTLPPETLGS